jgi:hypothetical protein
MPSRRSRGDFYYFLPPEHFMREIFAGQRRLFLFLCQEHSTDKTFLIFKITEDDFGDFTTSWQTLFTDYFRAYIAVV